MRFILVNAVNDSDVRDSIERLVYHLRKGMLYRVTLAFDTDRVIETEANGNLLVYDRTPHMHFARLVARTVDARVRTVKWALHTIWSERAIKAQATRKALRMFWGALEQRCDQQSLTWEELKPDLEWVHREAVRIGDYDLSHHAFTALYEHSTILQKPFVTRLDRHADV